MNVNIALKSLISVAILVFCCSGKANAQHNYLNLQSSPQQVWKLKSQKEVSDFQEIFRANYQTNTWVNAIVPGTVYNSYVEAGKEKDPNWADNIWNADKAKFDQPYWYLTQFRVPETFTQKHTWLNFNGVNRKASIYLNGKLLGVLDGFMERGKFDISLIANKKDLNTLAVLVDVPKHPMANAASPTYVSSGGWDWMPYVPGLNAGITDKVFLTNSGGIAIHDPWVRTELPTNAKANLSVELGVMNNKSEQQQITVVGTINPGNITFSQKVTVPANTLSQVKMDKRYFSQLVINSPKLWWPNGYGEPNLYSCELKVLEGTTVSDSKTIKFGIKKYSYDTSGEAFHIAVNGVKIFVKGGNWAMSEYMLKCRGDDYDIKVRLHKEMNLNMIRNWIGSTTDEEFYDACDKYGIMIWDDFWLNSNRDLPRNVNNFNFNVIEKIKRVRNHPSIAVWCGNNEGWPEPPLDAWIKEDIRTYDGGDRHYQSNSRTGALSGSGPWSNKDPRYYFTKYPSGQGGNEGWGFRTELGSAVFTNVESFKKFMPKEYLWPRNEMWDKHFFGPWAYNADPDNYDKSIDKYGKPDGIEDYCRKAQLVNIETNKAMYEGWLDHLWDDASGILSWTSNASNPTLIWQSYDYYYDLTGAYWGIKSACEPLHIQWNPVTNEVKTINTTRKDAENLKAEIEIYNLDGKLVKKYSKSGEVNALANSAVTCFTIPFNQEKNNIALNKPAFASTTNHGKPNDVTDGNDETRWSSETVDNQWLYVDLGAEAVINGVKVNWQEAFAKSFKIQVSDDAKSWTDVYETSNGREGEQEIMFAEEVSAQYVRVFGMERGSWWGFSLRNFEVYAADLTGNGLSAVHFIKLKLKATDGKIISENFYWRGNRRKDFSALSELKPVELKVTSKTSLANGIIKIKAEIVNPLVQHKVAFANRVIVVNSKSGEQILPVFTSDGYFTLLPGESKTVDVEFRADLLGNDTPKLLVQPYNNPSLK